MPLFMKRNNDNSPNNLKKWWIWYAIVDIFSYRNIIVVILLEIITETW